MSNFTGTQDSSVEVKRKETGSQQIGMDHRLLKAVRSGNLKQLVELLPPKVNTPNHTTEEKRINIPDSTDMILLGVTSSGNTALHIACSHGHLELAEEICRRERSLLTAANNKRDTALHCAARAGDHQIVDLIIQLARESGEDGVTKVLMAKNSYGDTALHEAAQNGHLKVTEKLVEHGAELLSMVNDDGASPLFFAVMSRSLDVVQAMIKPSSKDMATRISKAGADGQAASFKEKATPIFPAGSEGQSASFKEITAPISDVDIQSPTAGLDGLSGQTASPEERTTPISPASSEGKTTSCKDTSTPISIAGPNGQTVLHAAVLQSREITDELLRWNARLIKEVDASGSTPFHYVASNGDRRTLNLLLEFDIPAACLPDASGSMPIHVAASTGNIDIIDELIKQCPDVEELLDARGNNFLHLAITMKKGSVARYACRNQKFEKLMNDKNNNGDTPLHLAVINGDQEIVGLLMQRKSVQISTTDKNGFTPLDLSLKGLERGLTNAMNSRVWITVCLAGAGAAFGPRRLDVFFRDNIQQADPEKETKKQLSLAKNLGIVTVLIATVTFAAAFTLPGGYQADADPNPGSPILARRYAFKVFIISDTLAFVCSIIATKCLTYAGSLSVDLHLRIRYLRLAFALMHIAGKCMIPAFAVGVYVVLSRISKRISILICVVAFTASALFDLSSTLLFEFKRGKTLVRRLGWKNGLFGAHRKLPARGISLWMQTPVIIGLMVIAELVVSLWFYWFMLAFASL